MTRLPSLCHSVGTCLITVATGNINGYAEIDISNKKPLEDFSVFMWVKPRLPDNAKMTLFSYVVKNDPILALAHYGKGSSRIGLFNSRM